jgi:hypothetical protein
MTSFYQERAHVSISRNPRSWCRSCKRKGYGESRKRAGSGSRRLRMKSTLNPVKRLLWSSGRGLCAGRSITWKILGASHNRPEPWRLWKGHYKCSCGDDTGCISHRWTTKSDRDCYSSRGCIGALQEPLACRSVCKEVMKRWTARNPARVRIFPQRPIQTTDRILYMGSGCNKINDMLKLTWGIV